MRTPLAVFILLCYINFSCKSKNKLINHIFYEDSLKTLLIGEWGMSDTSKPILRIDKDSIYYLQSEEHYSYRLDSNNLVYRPSTRETQFHDISIINDTMVYHEPNDGMLLKLYRFKRRK